MLDKKYIIQNVELIKKNCKNRNVFVDVDQYVEIEKLRTTSERYLQEIKQRINNLRGKKGDLSDEEQKEAKILKIEASKVKKNLTKQTEDATLLLKQIPNITHPDTPIGLNEKDGVEIYRSQKPIPTFNFNSLDHKDLGEALGYLDMESGTKVAKPGFYFLKGDLALLEIALMRFAIDHVIKSGYELHITPEVANNYIMDGTGYSPKGKESNIFTIDENLNLIATSEIVLCGMFKDSIFSEKDLPLRVAGLSHCFRTERASGRATRGLYRVHQFQKIELVVICTPEDGEKMHKEILEIEKNIFEELELPFRVIDIASGDLGAPAYRKYDIEAWMPHRGDGGEFGEVTSTSNCTDYQSRRLNIRYKDSITEKNKYTYTLNGTGLAIGRAMIALLENNQQEDLSVILPKKIWPYFGKDKILPRL